LDERIVLVVTDQHAMHHVRERGYVESPARIAWIMKELGPTGLFLPVPPRSYPEKHIRDVHASDLVEYIKKACKNAGPGESIYPYVFPIRNAARPPRDLAVRAGYYCVDTFTPLNANAYRAAKRAVDCAMTAAEQILRGHRIAYALVRPPGHHAERRTFGGFCYFNSAAVAAQHLSHHGKVAMLDIDYHHGNGQQDIFYERSDVMTISVHADPRVAYPHFTGFSDERGAGPGEGYNVNLPLPDDVDGERYRETLRRALLHVSRFRPAFLVLALGLDTAKGDPTGSWRLRAADFEIHGTMIGSLRIPTLVTQEGGYSSRSLGTVARRFFQGLWAGYHQHRWEGHSG
jgi:acetoin utilization deacetylase AcuC-like enzyme